MHIYIYIYTPQCMYNIHINYITINLRYISLQWDWRLWATWDTSNMHPKEDQQFSWVHALGSALNICNSHIHKQIAALLTTLVAILQVSGSNDMRQFTSSRLLVFGWSSLWFCYLGWQVERDPLSADGRGDRALPRWIGWFVAGLLHRSTSRVDRLAATCQPIRIPHCQDLIVFVIPSLINLNH